MHNLSNLSLIAPELFLVCHGNRVSADRGHTGETGQQML